MCLDMSNDTGTGFQRVYNSNSLYDAFRLSEKESYWKCSCQKYEYNLLRNVFKTKKNLISESYQQMPFYEFDINERGKHRHIKSLHISDRVVQRSFCDNSLIPATRSKLVYDNGASIKDKGISFARKRIMVHLRKFYTEFGNDGYILQIDFKKFFDSIPHQKLEEMFKKHLDEGEYGLFCNLVRTFEGDRGVGIGSQVSQICGIYYPTPIDNYLKIVKRCRFYGRYMDDTYIIDKDKGRLREILNEYLKIAAEIGLEVSLKKTHIVKLSHGFTFLKIKYNLLEDGTILRRLSRSTVTRERRKLKRYRVLVDKGVLSPDEIRNAYESWRGTYRKFNSHRTIREMDRLYTSLFGGNYGRKKR